MPDPTPSATTPTDTPNPVRVELHAEWHGGYASEVFEYDRAVWEAKTPAERQQMLSEGALEWLYSNGAGCGYSILGDDAGSDEVSW